MSACTFPLRCALLAAALAQLMPATAGAAGAKKEADANAIKACDDCPDVGGWSGWLEGGLDAQSNESWHFGRYTGLEDSGAHLVAGADVQYRGKDEVYMNARGVDLGLSSRDVVLEGGKQGKYGVSVEYDQIPNYRDPTTSPHLKTERDRTGIKLSMVPGKGWEIGASFRHEEKDGTRDVGTTFGFSQTAVLPVPFKYETDDFGLSAGYTDKKLQAQLAYSGSAFKNDQTGFAWTNAFPSPLAATGRLAESPENQFHQLSALFGYQVMDHTRISGQAALGHGTQNAGFQPNTTASPSPTLPVASLDGKVDTRLYKLELNSRPMSRLRLDGSYTYSQRDNKTPVNQYDYVLTDTLFDPYQRPNRPYSFAQHLMRLKAGYLLPANVDLSVGYDHDRQNRSYQQVAQTQDDTLWAKLRLHPTEIIEATLKASHSKRDASAYDATAYQNPANPENPLMRAFEMADRTRDKFGLGLAINTVGGLTLGLDLDYYKDDYTNMVLGLTKADGLTYTPSLSYAFNDRLTGSAFYTYEKLNSNQASREWLPPPSTFNNPWTESDSNLTQTYGLSFSWKAIPKKLDIGADLVHADFTGKISYGGAGASSLPDLVSTLDSIGVHGSYRLKDNLSLRAGCWYERYKESDWAKLSIALPTLTTLGASPQNVNTTLVSVSARYDLK